MSGLAFADPAMSVPGSETFFGKGLRARLTLEKEQAVVAEHEHTEPLLVSPELALVCPELRELALQQLPERDPDCFLPRPLEPSHQDVSRPTGSASPRALAEWTLPVGADEGEEDSSDLPLVLSLLAYTVQRSVSMATYGAGVIAATAGFVVLLAQFHS